MTIRLRDYQEQCLADLAKHRLDHPDETRLAVVMATGLGKTITFAAEAHRFIAAGDSPQADSRVLILVHTDELAQQAVAKIKLVVGRALTIGVVKAERNEVNADIIVGSVQTLANPARRDQLTGVGHIIVDECFPAGTMVGDKAIESLKPGDQVPSWDEQTGREVLAPVIALMRRAPQHMVRATLDDGRVIECTPNHPLMTTSGWCNAGGLWRGAQVISFTHDATTGTMRSVQDDCGPVDSAEAPTGDLQKNGASVLFRPVSGSVDRSTFGGHDGPDKQGVCVGANEGEQPHGSVGIPTQDGCHATRDEPPSPVAGRERGANTGAATALGVVSGLGHGAVDRAEGRRAPVSLQRGYRSPRHEGPSGSGRGIPLLAGPPSLRPAPGRKAVTARVVDVQILEPGSDGTYGGVCPDGLVYNIEVAGTHTYLITGGLVVHNCHHAIAPAYQAILRHYGAFGYCPMPYTTTVTGYTATLERGDGNSLGSVWQNVAFSRSISWAVRKGFLVPPRAYRVEVPGLDLRPSVVASDQVMDRGLIDSIAPEAVVNSWLDRAKGRSTVLFAPLVRSASAFAEAFNASGVHAAVVHGGMPERQRRATLQQYESGDLDVLCNAMVLTEGWDSPRTGCVIVARPTQSRPLFIQMAGRGLRPWLEPTAPPREEQDCILLVVADATTELRSMADLSDRPIKAEDGKTILALEDEFDLTSGLEPDPEHAYDGKVHLREFDPLVAKSSKIWQTTYGGVLFVPAGDRRWVCVLPVGHEWLVVACLPRESQRVDAAPDLEMALALAEDTATDLGGNLTALYADKNRAWRKKRPTEPMMMYARRLGLGQQVEAILATTRGGKAGRVSDLIDRTVASRRIDRLVGKWRS